ncbi:MAG: FAD-dependent thymidylate synthase [Oscillospiraceae bacterium]|nr:FAD-dependent thymidylate synthase [Oscillospiraceae bacterium]
MYVEWLKCEDNWQDIKNATMTTIGKSRGAYPDHEWKLKLIRSEHSPIRKLKFSWRWKDLPYWVSVHFVRHKIGIEHFVSTQRSDRTNVPRDELPQGAFVTHECEADAQALINISRKRLCTCASPETRQAWQLVKDEVKKVQPELAKCMVRECVYRGFCPEMFGCGFDKTEEYQKELAEYRKDD